MELEFVGYELNSADITSWVSIKIDLEVNIWACNKIKFWRRKCNIHIASTDNKPFENVSTFQYLGATKTAFRENVLLFVWNFSRYV